MIDNSSLGRTRFHTLFYQRAKLSLESERCLNLSFHLFYWTLLVEPVINKKSVQSCQNLIHSTTKFKKVVQQVWQRRKWCKAVVAKQIYGNIEIWSSLGVKQIGNIEFWEWEGWHSRVALLFSDRYTAGNIEMTNWKYQDDKQKKYWNDK